MSKTICSSIKPNPTRLDEHASQMYLLRNDVEKQATSEDTHENLLKADQVTKEEFRNSKAKKETKSSKREHMKSIGKTIANAFSVTVAYAILEPYMRLATMDLQGNPLNEVIAAVLFAAGAVGWFVSQYVSQKGKCADSNKNEYSK